MVNISLELKFTVRIVAPVEMPLLVYRISWQDILVRAESKEQHKLVIFQILQEHIIKDYNLRVEAMPIMDMFDDPTRFQNLYDVDWSFVYPDSNKPAKLI